ncbi:PAS domain S-box protein [Altererythrobacter lauratis]|uniref:histidine kinase n=1 Tax=Alteraurantiacibacter lauratis TaxID=2054627 RepID=A0ABV7EDP5_9SPHN
MDRLLPEVTDLYAALVASCDDAIVAKDTDGVVLSWNPAAERLFGWSAAEIVGQSIRRLIPQDRQHEEDEILAMIRSGEKVGQRLTRRLHRDGHLVDVWVSVSPVHNAAGQIVGASKIARDAGNYLRNQRELREAKERFEALADNIAPMAWIVAPDGKVEWYSQRWYDFTGTDYDYMTTHGADGILHPDHAERVRAHFRACLESGQDWEDTFPLRRRDGVWRWFLSRAKPMRDEDGRVLRWFGTNSDITEQREQAEQIRLLLMEVNHRSKNMLTTIQALLRRSVEEDEEFVRRFQQRIQCLAVNQDILVRREWREVPLDELVELQLEFAADAAGKVVAEGPDIAINPRAAETLGMALHELATNSLKYGALSADGGEVDVRWHVQEGTFVLRWSESGGPPVAKPARKGFGTRLICEVPQRALGGSAAIDYDPRGIVWELAVPLAAVAG